ncbi:MAG: hypothetical protein ABIR96_01180, partial [Bdellovibrionota bacterium]
VLEEMSIVGRADHLQTARMMAGGLDALSIFPSHCIEDLLKTHRLKELGKTQTRLRHPIHIVALEGRLQSERVRVVTDAFFKML